MNCYNSENLTDNLNKRRMDRNRQKTRKRSNKWSVCFWKEEENDWLEIQPRQRREILQDIHKKAAETEGPPGNFLKEQVHQNYCRKLLQTIFELAFLQTLLSPGVTSPINVTPLPKNNPKTQNECRWKKKCDEAFRGPAQLKAFWQTGEAREAEGESQLRLTQQQEIKGPTLRHQAHPQTSDRDSIKDTTFSSYDASWRIHEQEEEKENLKSEHSG